jgi:hypothetical protein
VRSRNEERISEALRGITTEVSEVSEIVEDENELIEWIEIKFRRQ